MECTGHDYKCEVCDAMECTGHDYKCEVCDVMECTGHDYNCEVCESWNVPDTIIIVRFVSHGMYWTRL